MKFINQQWINSEFDVCENKKEQLILKIKRIIIKEF
jgi:hypothetical protein